MKKPASVKVVNRIHIFLIGLAFILIGLAFIIFRLFSHHSYASQPIVGSWTSVGLSNYNDWEMSVDPSNPNTLYETTLTTGTFKSTDGGINWNNIGLTNIVTYGPVVVNPSNTNTIYVGAIGGNTGGVFKSTDGGANWTNTTNNMQYPYRVSTLVMDPNNPNTLYAGNYQSGGLWKTTDGGANWTQTGLRTDIARVLVDPTNSNTIYATIAFAVLKSVDGGANWTQLSPPGGRGIAMDPNNHNILYVTTGSSGGIYKTSDGGANWSILPNSPQGVIVYALATDPISPNTVYAGDADGVHISTDGGATWSTINNGLPSDTIRYLLVPANNPNVLYAVTASSGIYEYGLRASNQPPVVGAITAPTTPVQVNTAITASAPFTDPDVSDTFTASWNWGDGTTTPGTVTAANGSGTAKGTHTYTTAGMYTITLTVTDNAGLQGTSTFQYVVVYDPNAGFLTGGGYYVSQAGWDTQNTQASGQVNFGLNAKYTTGNNIPTGQTELNFKEGNINLHSTSYAWLVVSGAKATLKGTGTINGSGNYTFLISGIDGSGTGGQNLIRVKITDALNTVIYDTQAGAADTADPTTALTNGSIKVH